MNTPHRIHPSLFILGLLGLATLLAYLFRAVPTSERSKQAPDRTISEAANETESGSPSEKSHAAFSSFSRTRPKFDLPDPAAVPYLLQRFADIYAKSPLHRSHSTWTPLFGSERDLRLREARLIALVYPDQAKKFAVSVFCDRSRPLLERDYGCFLLARLTLHGDPAAQAELLRTARSREDPMSESALATIASIDVGGEHRGLYRERAREGSLNAIQILEFWGDPATIDLMKGLIAANPALEAPQSSIRLAAQDTLRKVETLLSPDADVRIAALIETPSPENDAWTLWALHVAKIRKIPGLAEILRKRLDAAYRDARRLEERMAVRGGFLPSFLDENMVTGYDYVTDNYFDDILVLQSEIGGPLTDLEKARLRHFGYACDPRERLAELLAEEAAAPK
jgi:hypothetical protein